MSQNMLTAYIAVPAHRIQLPDFDAGRRTLAQITEVTEFDVAPSVTLDTAIEHCAQIIDNLERAFTELSTEIDSVELAGYRLYISAGLSGGDAPTEAAQIIWDAQDLPADVFTAMGFVFRTELPVAQALSTSDKLTDSDIIDAIALMLGTNPEWENPSAYLEDIANLIGQVRQHPGGQDPQEYVEQHTIARGYDPLEDRLMVKFVSDEGRPDEDDDENTDE